jgi:hypothetical protein
MPFEQVLPRPFNTNTIRNHAPMQSGVYGISNARRWLEIGETDNIQATLLELLSDSRTQQGNPTGFVFEVCDRAARASRHARLNTEYKPRSL